LIELHCFFTHVVRHYYFASYCLSEMVTEYQTLSKIRTATP